MIRKNFIRQQILEKASSLSLSLSLLSVTKHTHPKAHRVLLPGFVRNGATRGFTIVELLIVIVVIGVLAAISFIGYNTLQNRAAASVLQSDLKGAATQLDLIRAESGAYSNPTLPGSINKSNGTKFQYTSDGSSYCLTATSVRTSVLPYRVSSTSSVVQGMCPGHTADGGSLATAPSPDAGEFVLVPGNSIFGTSDFYVAKYEAKNVSGKAVSRAEDTPWVSITQTNAIARASETCDGCHLITEAEWMTLAANVLSVPSNWSGGSIGSGVIYSGHNDNNPANALAATTDDNDGYNGTGNTSGSNQRRTLTLTNGEVIWDLAGNVNEWTSGTISGNQPGLSTDNVDGASFAWKQWNNSSMNWNNLPASSRPSAIAAVPGLSNINSWTSTHGIGQLYSNQNQTSVRAFRRGGDWTFGSLAGVLALGLNYAPGSTATSIGFRVAR